MGFHVDYNALDDLYLGLRGHATSWETLLQNVDSCVGNLITSANMAGTGAEKLKAYLDANHNAILTSLWQLITLHTNNCLLYVRDYQSNVDTSLHAVIDEDELDTISNQLAIYSNETESIDGQAQAALRSVSDLIYLSCYGNAEIQSEYRDIDLLIRSLRESVLALEDAHYQNDFTETTRLVSALQTYIQECLRHDRAYKLDFSVDSIANSATFLELYHAYADANTQLEAQQNDVSIATDEEAHRMELLREEREQKANTEKWAVTGLCVIGSFVAIGAIVLTGGAATPLVVGTVSAVSGVVMAANNAAADEYVEYGWNTDEWNKGKIVGDAVMGGVTGFVTGYIGASVSQPVSKVVSQAVSTTVSESTIGTALLNSSSTAIRVGTNAVIGSVSEIASGIASREVGTFAVTMVTSGGDVDASWKAAHESAFNLQSVVFDGVFGGGLGAWSGFKKSTPTGHEYNKQESELFDFHSEQVKNESELFDLYSEQVKNGTVSSLCTFEDYKQQYALIEENVIGITTSNGIPITSQSNHFMERVIGTIEDPETHRPRNGVSVDSIVDALKNPLDIGEPRIDPNGLKSQKFIGEHGTVTVNPDTGKLIQCNPTNSALAEKLKRLKNNGTP